ncbi:SIMPL domain-containing protein [Breznakiella homolactica]|uniref:SIMPL domain-containing protein n=1 Tax=Breznakiella homolactica TaxID=2798577 RepID=A0A7T7XMV7_9SPIR|nr:SIMPL domain-containing protein [Breznakiella homolactica]QQO09192.1 SIMPL domain-containing protein [Breznakiella homolactica]
MKKLSVFVFAALAVCIAMPVFAGGSSEKGADTITVFAQGIVTAVPDTAVVQLGIETRSPSVKDAFAQNRETMVNLRSVVLGFGIKESDISTVNYSVFYEEPYSADPQTKREGFYRVSNGISVTVRNSESIGSLIGAAVEAGANQLWGVSFYVSDSSAAEQEAREQAIKNAEAKAATLAGAAGRKLGAVVSIAETDGYSPAPMMLMSARSAAYAADNGTVSPGEAEIRSSVQVVYSLK